MYGTIAATGENELDNYLDNNKDYPDFKKGTVPDMKKRIMKKFETCRGEYGLLTNNCEHLATYVRYGVELSLQVWDTLTMSAARQGPN